MNTTKLARRARHAHVGQAVLILLAVLVAGCTKQQMYRPDNVEKGTWQLAVALREEVR